MRLVNSDYGLNVSLSENQHALVVIENKAAMSRIIADLWEQCEGGAGTFALVDGDNIIRIEKTMEIIINPFAISFSTKKINNALFKSLEMYAQELIEEKSSLNSLIVDSLEKVVIHEPYENIEYNFDFDWSGIFKLYEIRIAEDFESLEEKLIEYIKLATSLLGIEIIGLVGICAYLDDQQIDSLLAQANYNKAKLLLLEPIEPDISGVANTYIIDKDLCVIVK